MGYLEKECVKHTGKKCLSDNDMESMKQHLPNCLKLIKSCNSLKSDFPCLVARNSMDCGMQFIPVNKKKINVYDIRKPCIGSSCYNFSKISSLFTNISIQKDL